MDSGIVRFMGHPKMVGGPTVTQWIQEFDMYARMMLLMFWNSVILHHVPRQVVRVNKNIESWTLMTDRI